MDLPSLPRDPALWSALFAGLALLVAGYMAYLNKSMADATKQAASAADRSAVTGQGALEAAKASAEASRASASIAQAGLPVQFVIQPVELPPPFDDEDDGARYLAVSCPTANVFVHRLEVQRISAKSHSIYEHVHVSMVGNGPKRLHPSETAAGRVDQPQPQEVLDVLGKPHDITGGEATVWYSFAADSEQIPIQAPIVGKPSTRLEPRPRPQYEPHDEPSSD